jgi:hypothetical protein
MRENNLGLTKSALKSVDIKKAFRWLIFYDFYLDYQYIYVGDIDILISKENENIVDQHVKHMNYLNTNYSNIFRFREPRTTIKEVLSKLKKWGFRITINNFSNRNQITPRLSGLHFYSTSIYNEEYFSSLKKVINDINITFQGKSKENSIFNYNTDEFVLFKVIYGSNNKISIVNENSSNSPQSIRFRPVHGIHLRNWRDNPDRWRHSILNEISLIHYKSIKKYFDDEIFLNLLNINNTAKKLIINMKHYYESSNHLHESKIK